MPTHAINGAMPRSVIDILARLLVPAVVIVCCGLPLAWLAGQIAWHADAVAEVWRRAGFVIALTGRTILYAGFAAALASALAIPAVLLLGRGRRGLGALWLALAMNLLLPPITLAYAWWCLLARVDRWTHAELSGGVFQAVWTLAAWLWPIPAVVVGQALRRMDPGVQLQGLLDGAMWRMTLRYLIGPALAAAAVVAILSMQEITVWDARNFAPENQVVATKVRTEFEGMDQNRRAATAAAYALPTLGLLLVLGGALWWHARRVDTSADIACEHWPKRLDAPGWAWPAGGAVIALTLVLPVMATWADLKVPLDIGRTLETYRPQLQGSLTIGAWAGLLGLGLACGAAVRRQRAMLALAIVGFLCGGQLLAIGLIRLYNRPWLNWIYDQPPILVMAYLGRFGWIALLAGMLTWSRPWRALREMSAVDGASAGRTLVHVVAPLAWPWFAAAGVIIMNLAVGEVPATMILHGAGVPVLVSHLVSNVHNLHYDEMIRPCLLMMLVCAALGAVAMALAAPLTVTLTVTRARSVSGGAKVLLCVLMVLMCGCERGGKPEAVWGSTGRGPGQMIYPRAICTAADGSVFVVDRYARVQHWDARGGYLNEWQMPQYEQGKPTGLSMGPDGYLYVADTHYHRIMVYTPAGELVRQWGGEGTGHGEFMLPTDIAFDDDGNCYVSEYNGNDRVQVFDPHGVWLRQFGRFGGSDGELSRPQSMVILDGLVYIADACNHRIAVFTTGGAFVRNMGRLGSKLGELRFPYGLDHDGQGNLIVCEMGNNRVQLMDRNTGRGLRTWGRAGGAAGDLMYPWAAVMDRSGRVIVVDSGNNRVQVFRW